MRQHPLRPPPMNKDWRQGRGLEASRRGDGGDCVTHIDEPNALKGRLPNEHRRAPHLFLH